MSSEIVSKSPILSVRDEIRRINAWKAASVDIRHVSKDQQIPRREGEEAQESSALSEATGLSAEVPSPQPDSDSSSDTSSCVSSASKSTTGSRCERAKKGDIYTMANSEEVDRIRKEINEGRLVSNTKCAPWGPGQKHNPDHPHTVQVRNHLSSGSKTKEYLVLALPSITKKLIGSILHELREQGLVTVKRAGKN
jgi:hypothetical protein